jgi:hypothetical protein
MFARLDQGGGRLARAGVEPPVVSEQPGEARAAGPCGRLAIEQGREQAKCVDELAHGRADLQIRRRRQQKLEPGYTALGQAGPRDAETRAPPRLSVRQRIRQVPIALHRRFVRGQRRTRIREHGAQQIGEKQRESLGQEALALLRVRPRQFCPDPGSTQPSCVGRVRHGSQCSGSAAHRNYVKMGPSSPTELGFAGNGYCARSGDPPQRNRNLMKRRIL